MRRVNPDYYGFLDEDDGVILQEEQRAQKEVFLKLGEGQEPEYVQQRVDELCAISSKLVKPSMDCSGPKSYVSYVPSIPSQTQIQEELLRLRKEEVLKRIQDEFGDIPMEDEEEAQAEQVESIQE